MDCRAGGCDDARRRSITGLGCAVNERPLPCELRGEAWEGVYRVEFIAARVRSVASRWWVLACCQYQSGTVSSWDCSGQCQPGLVFAELAS